MKRTFAVLIATWFYSGFFHPSFIRKKMAGTWGSLFSLPLCWFILYFGREDATFWMSLAVWIVFWMGIAFVKKAEQDIGPQVDWKGKAKSKDQNEIVIDETLGILITCLPLTFMDVGNNYWIFFLSLVAFGLFRLFDIVKVPPTKVFDRMHNAFGVMMDDVMAGLYAALCLWGIIKLFFS